MLLDQENVDQGDVRRQIADLARTLASQNANLALAERCQEHLSIILEMLCERPVAMWMHKELRDSAESFIYSGNQYRKYQPIKEKIQKTSLENCTIHFQWQLILCLQSKIDKNNSNHCL